MGDYYISTRYIRVASRVAERLETEELRKLEVLEKCLNFIELPHSPQTPCQNENFVSTSKKVTKNSD